MDDMGAQRPTSPPAWWLAKTWAFLQASKALKWRPTKDGLAAAAQFARSLASFFGIASAIALALIFVPPQASVWGSRLGFEAFGWSAGQGESYHRAADTVANQALWSQAVAGLASDEERRGSEHVWRAAQSAAKQSNEAHLWIDHRDLKALIAASPNLAATRREAALSALVDAMASGDSAQEGFDKARSAVLGSSKPGAIDPPGQVKAMLGQAIPCQGLALSAAFLPYAPTTAACESGATGSAAPAYWICGLILLALAAAAAWILRKIFLALKSAVSSWASGARGELMSDWERQQLGKSAAPAAQAKGRPSRI